MELSSWKGGPRPAVIRLRTLLATLRTCGLTVAGAEAAGEILLDKLKSRPAGKGRNEIKYDALIAGIAHAMKARWLITGNAKDYRPLLSHIKSSVEIVDIDTPPARVGAQLTINDR